MPITECTECLYLSLRLARLGNEICISQNKKENLMRPRVLLVFADKKAQGPAIDNPNQISQWVMSKEMSHAHKTFSESAGKTDP